MLGYSLFKMSETLNVGSKNLAHQDNIIFLLLLVVSLVGHTLSILKCCYVTNRLTLSEICSTDFVLCAHDSYIMVVFVLILFCHVVYFLIDVKIIKCDFSAIVWLEYHLKISSWLLCTNSRLCHDARKSRLSQGRGRWLGVHLAQSGSNSLGLYLLQRRIGPLSVHKSRSGRSGLLGDPLTQ